MAVDLPLRDRASAGRLLASEILATREPWDLVLGLPRGGVVVAYEIALALSCELDVFITRKVGAPDQPDLALGAVAETGLIVINQRLVIDVGIGQPDLRAAVEHEQAEISRQIQAFRGERAVPVIAGRSVLVVDDGVATGATPLTALRALRAQGPARLGLAVPVCPPQILEGFRQEVHRLFGLATPHPFGSVGAWYEDFHQVESETVVALLDAARMRMEGWK
jgi:putative phosphoribosyl transferase